MAEWQARFVPLANAQLEVRTAGEGAPLLILHDELGPPQFQAWHGELAKSRKLIAPVAPGFVGERLKWMRCVRDLAALYGGLLRAMDLAPIDVIGMSFGGWVAAEMAVQNPTQFRAMTLVAPFGLKPPEGVIADMFLMSSAEWIRAGFADPDKVEEFASLFGEAQAEQVEAWEDARVECAQLAWQPYMFEPAMQELAPVVGALPTLLIHGDKDAIVPVAASRAYCEALANARLEIFKGCGHRPELEARQAFVETITRFLDGAERRRAKA